MNAITTWPPIGSNATSSSSATIVSPSLHTRSLLCGCGVVRQRLLERLDRLARLLQRQVGGEQVLRRLHRDEVAERVVEAAALADGRADEPGLHPVAQARLLDGEDAGDIANAEYSSIMGFSSAASTFKDRCSSAPRERLVDIDVRRDELAAGGLPGLGDRDAARVLAAALVGRVQERDPLRGRRVGRIADDVRGAREVDGQHRRAGVDVAGELALGEHARGVVQELDGDRCEAHRDLPLEQRHAAGHRHRFFRRNGLGAWRTRRGLGIAEKW